MNYASRTTTTTTTTSRRLRLGLLVTLAVVASSASLPHNEEGQASISQSLRGHRTTTRSLNSVLEKDNLFRHEPPESIDEGNIGIGIGDAEVTAVEDFYMGDGETIVTVDEGDVEIEVPETRPPAKEDDEDEDEQIFQTAHPFSGDQTVAPFRERPITSGEVDSDTMEEDDEDEDEEIFQTAHPFSGDQTVAPFRERPIASGEVGNDNDNYDYDDQDTQFESFPPKPESDVEDTPADFDTDSEAPPTGTGTDNDTDTDTGSVAQDEIQVVQEEVDVILREDEYDLLRDRDTAKKTKDEEDLFEEEETKLVRGDDDEEDDDTTTGSSSSTPDNVPTKHYLIFAGLCVTLLLLYMMYWRDSIISQRLEFLLKQQEARDRLKNLHDNIDDESISIDERDFGEGNLKFYHSNSHLNHHHSHSNSNSKDDDPDSPENFNFKPMAMTPDHHKKRISNITGATFPDDDATLSLSPPQSPPSSTKSKEHWKKYETIGL